MEAAGEEEDIDLLLPLDQIAATASTRDEIACKIGMHLGDILSRLDYTKSLIQEHCKCEKPPTNFFSNQKSQSEAEVILYRRYLLVIARLQTQAAFFRKNNASGYGGKNLMKRPPQESL